MLEPIGRAFRACDAVLSSEAVPVEALHGAPPIGDGVLVGVGACARHSECD